MTRKEQIKEAAYQRYCNDSSVTFGLQCNSFKEGAKWADQHPKEGLVDVEKVEQWIKECFAFLNDAGHHNFKVDKFIENFRIAMEE